ncbi:MAG: ATP-binding protein [Bacteroidota bacterium]
MTAITFIVASISILLTPQAGTTLAHPSRYYRLAKMLSWIIILIGTIKFSGYFTGWDAGIDQWLFSDKLSMGTVKPNRMAPNTAFNFMITGLVLVLMHRTSDKYYRLAQILIIVLAMSSLFAIIGYVYGIKAFYGVGVFTPMALHTSLVFMLVCLSLLYIRPDKGLLAHLLSDLAGGIMARKLLPLAVLFPLILGWLRLEAQRIFPFSTEFTVGLLMVLIISFFGLLILLVAGSLNRLEEEKWQMQTLLAEKEAFLHAVTVICPEVIRVENWLTQEIVYLNKPHDISGYSIHEIRGMKKKLPDLLIHPLDYQRVINHLQEISFTREGEEKFIEFRLKHKAGHYIWVNERRTIFSRTADGKVKEVLGCAQDITERKESEEVLRQAYDEIQASEEESKQRGEELSTINDNLAQAIEELKATQIQLVQSEKLASLGQLTAGIAHEINNPINFVQAGVENLKSSLSELFQVLEQYELLESAASESTVLAGLQRIAQLKAALYYHDNKFVVQETLYSIASGAARTAEIVRGLRNFSRLDEAEMKRAALHEGIDNTLALLTYQLKDKITVIKAYAPQLPLIECYPGQLNQVFLNIFTNALQAMDKQATGELQIATTVFVDHLQIAISDTGCGIATEVLPRIFAPFFTTKPVGQGTGLGLSISYNIIQKHQGTIVAHSELGKGTQFIISLPVNKINMVGGNISS